MEPRERPRVEGTSGSLSTLVTLGSFSCLYVGTGHLQRAWKRLSWAPVGGKLTIPTDSPNGPSPWGSRQPGWRRTHCPGRWRGRGLQLGLTARELPPRESPRTAASVVHSTSPRWLGESCQAPARAARGPELQRDPSPVPRWCQPGRLCTEDAVRPCLTSGHRDRRQVCCSKSIRL